ncbi:hypothetical protein BpHYR1_035361 [Brachionus plicatilis]|uniref:Uncharacterized protein n=1 Tax=Brachionus plicatilis TaxID=10195 RepID=A0A3M7S8D1_BRAPC|nr:hypothetical protein BpHYR1_035361 [Brachionus plicatilis]
MVLENVLKDYKSQTIEKVINLTIFCTLVALVKSEQPVFGTCSTESENKNRFVQSELFFKILLNVYKTSTIILYNRLSIFKKSNIKIIFKIINLWKKNEKRQKYLIVLSKRHKNRYFYALFKNIISFGMYLESYEGMKMGVIYTRCCFFAIFMGRLVSSPK